MYNSWFNFSKVSMFGKIVGKLVSVCLYICWIALFINLLFFSSYVKCIFVDLLPNREQNEFYNFIFPKYQFVCTYHLLDDIYWFPATLSSSVLKDTVFYSFRGINRSILSFSIKRMYFDHQRIHRSLSMYIVTLYLLYLKCQKSKEDAERKVAATSKCFQKPT